ncbi:MAG: long-chain fatty acid--CoA ligase [Gammaproteobacteria bacterium]|nr:long-chain fatty acid--CoA ligase [Gammaproteobacteria bacterium]
MASYNLNLKRVVERPEQYFPRKEIVSRQADGSLFRYTYAEFCARTRRLASALASLGVAPGDKVATLAWNTHHHLELYFGVPCSGAVLHTANLRLSEEHIAYTMNHAADKVVFFSPDLLATVETLAPLLTTVERFVILAAQVPASSLPGLVAYEDLIARGDPDYAYPDVDEDAPASICFTSATTGNPKGVVYSHRALVLHSMMLSHVDCMALSERDVLMPIAPMFHVNSWGVPFAGVWVGAKFVFPGERPHAADNIALIESERVSFAHGAVTVGIDMMNLLRQEAHDIRSLRGLMLGGQATPAAVMRYYLEQHGIPIVTAWGSTECAPLATVTYLRGDQQDLPDDEKIRIRTRQGIPAPCVERKVLDDAGELIPWDDEAVGEVYVRGPWIATTYLDEPRSAESFVDGWWKSGDIAAVDGDGVMRLVDRAKDLIKSGGEWISSVDLENALMAHPAITEATVIGMPHEKWLERPVAFVRAAGDERPDDATLGAWLTEAGFARWWLPDRFLWVEEIPKTGVGKFNKRLLRERLSDYMADC